MPTPRQTTTARGYGANHQRLAKTLKQAALGKQCPGPTEGPRSPRCVGTMTDVKQMHADHGTPLSQGGTTADRVCCVHCNTSHGGRLGADKTNAPKTYTPSRRW